MKQQAWLVWDTETKELVRVVWGQEPDARVGEWKPSYRAMKWTPLDQEQVTEERNRYREALESYADMPDGVHRLGFTNHFVTPSIARAALKGAP